MLKHLQTNLENLKIKENIIKRLKLQMPLEEKMKYSDYILNNHGSREELKSQVSNLYEDILRLV